MADIDFNELNSLANRIKEKTNKLEQLEDGQLFQALIDIWNIATPFSGLIFKDALIVHKHS
jgi:hypothetical protein